MNEWTPQREVGAVVASVVIVAAFLPWASVSIGLLADSPNGVDNGSDGWLTAGAALLAVIAFAVHNKVLYVVSFALAVGAAGLSIFDIRDVNALTDDVPPGLLVTASVGIGLWLTALGTIVYGVLLLVCRAGVPNPASAQQTVTPASG